MINGCENVRNTFLRNVSELLHGVTSEKIVVFHSYRCDNLSYSMVIVLIYNLIYVLQKCILAIMNNGREDGKTVCYLTMCAAMCGLLLSDLECRRLPVRLWNSSSRMIHPSRLFCCCCLLNCNDHSRSTYGGQ
jgi:hypothetical protein